MKMQLYINQSPFFKGLSEANRSELATIGKVKEVKKRDYLFHEGENDYSLSDLFGENSQLVIYHFMFHPDDNKGCPICSFWADQFNPIAKHVSKRCSGNCQ